MDPISRALATPGADFWIPVNGATLAPLARPGDRARMRACGAEALRRGDLALLGRGEVWAVRLVTGTRPLRTATLREEGAPEPGEARARVVALERAGRVRRWSAARRLRALLLHRLLSGRAGAAARTLRDLARRLPPARSLRGRRVGAVRVRRLEAADREALAGFAAANLPHLAPLLDRQLGGRWRTHGIALGAFGAEGRMVGFVFMDDYREEGVDLPGAWVRALSVAPEARRLGVGRMLAAALCDHAAAAGVACLRADVRSTNRASLRLLRELGFRDGAPELASRAGALLSAREAGAPIVVLERTLVPAGGVVGMTRIARGPEDD
jgi:ribosomal protein S18 acetylase RimI-like enzyme